MLAPLSFQPTKFVTNAAKRSRLEIPNYPGSRPGVFVNELTSGGLRAGGKDPYTGNPALWQP